MRIFRAAAGVLFIAAIAAGCAGGDTPARGATAAGSTTTDATPSIAAQGVGRVTGVPNVLTVAFSLHTQGDSAQQTLADNSAQTQGVLDALKAQGIEDKDVQTTNVSVGPRYDNRIPPRIIGYSADNSFTVKLRDLTKAGSQIDALVGVGGDALQVQGIGYSINDSTALLAQARADAVKRAGEQAQQMADAAGIELGAIRTISEVPQQTGYPFDQLQFSGRGTGGDAAASVPLAPGSQELTLTVTVVFDIG
ncbi:MAG: uncharacterized protein QOI95_3559 [Acidimicrobiaceae bacterium]|jgi:uncharacterized protein YggE